MSAKLGCGQKLWRMTSISRGPESDSTTMLSAPGCRCKADPPRKHEPYYQVSFTWQGRSQTHSVRQEHLATVRRQLRTYERLRALVTDWIAAGLELSRLRLAQAPSGSAPHQRSAHRAKSP